jgi:uncharacterized protein (TIGR02001 family)
MKKFAFKTRPLAIAALTLWSAAQAQAQSADAAAAPAISGNFALTSNYISRGFTQSWGQPALQGGFDYAAPSGWFVGTWASSLSGTEFRGASMELDVYGGYSATVGSTTLVAGVYTYLYPGSSSPLTEGRSYKYTEIKLGASRGIFSANAFVTVSKDYFGSFTDGQGSLWLDLNANPDLGNGYTLLTHVGVGRIAKHTEANWVDYKLGLSKAFTGNWTLTAAYTYAQDKDRFWTGSNFKTDVSGATLDKRLGAPAFALTIGKTF